MKKFEETLYVLVQNRIVSEIKLSALIFIQTRFSFHTDFVLEEWFILGSPFTQEWISNINSFIDFFS